MFQVTGWEVATGLTRREIWEGLVRKATDPVAFVPAIGECRVLESGEAGLVREIVVRGERLRERVTFQPMESVRFERLSGSALGWIENRIEEDEEGRLHLRFTFSLELRDDPGGDAEKAFADRMAASYLSAIRTTLAETRRRRSR